MRLVICFLLFYFFTFSDLLAQHSGAAISFGSPIDTAIKLSGNFGELRSNHFHAGLDIKTNNREGMKIYSVADGYISKIKVSPYGYGKMLYITHPNGVVSIYAHLQSYNDTIQKYARAEQYKNKSFEVEFSLSPGQIPVKKGDFVALSGNTGASEGPHLHFEIRDASTEVAFNPLLFGFDVKDHTPPVIYGLMIYPADAFALINNHNLAKKVRIIKSKGKYESAETVVIQGNVYFGIEVYDSEDYSLHKNGAYSLEVLLDGEKIYDFKMDTIPFKDSRCINTHIDYQEKVQSNRSINRCCVTANNNLGIYKNVKNSGVVNFSDNKVHEVLFFAKDYFGNISQLTLPIKSRLVIAREKTNKPDSAKGSVYFNCKNKNTFKTKDFSISLPDGVLYEDMDFNYSVSDTGNNRYSSIHRVHYANIPLNDYYDMSIKTKDVPTHIQNKLLVVSMAGGIKNIKECTYESGYVKCKARLFGSFKVVADTIGPEIKPFNIRNNKDLSQQQTIKVLIDDNLSGIKDYSATIDTQWILMEYDYKKKLLVYSFDESVGKGEHIFSLEVADEIGNISTYKANFTR